MTAPTRVSLVSMLVPVLVSVVKRSKFEALSVDQIVLPSVSSASRVRGSIRVVTLPTGVILRTVTALSPLISHIQVT